MDRSRACAPLGPWIVFPTEFAGINRTAEWKNEHSLLRLRSCRPEAHRLGYAFGVFRVNARPLPRPRVEISCPRLLQQELTRQPGHGVDPHPPSQLDERPEVAGAGQVEGVRGQGRG